MALTKTRPLFISGSLPRLCKFLPRRHSGQPIIEPNAASASILLMTSNLYGLRKLAMNDQDFECDPPAVDIADDRIGDKQHLALVTMYGSGCTSTPRQCSRTAFLRKRLARSRRLGISNQSAHDVVAVITHQRIGVEKDGADTAHHHETQGEVVDERMRRRQPPDKRRRRGDEQFDVNTGIGDENTLPFIRQRPGVGDVAVQAWR